MLTTRQSLAFGLGLTAIVIAACSGPSGASPLDGTGSPNATNGGPHDGKQGARRHAPGSNSPPVAGSGIFGAPLAELTAAELKDFADGLEEFQNQETPEGGLGPIYNNTGCFVCHSSPAVGGSTSIRVTRFGKLTAGVFDPLSSRGGSLLQSSSIDLAAQEIVPADANVAAFRQSTPLFGMGLIEAIDDSTIIENASRSGVTGVRGTVAFVTDVTTGKSRVGRFGWKAQVATLLHFAGDAYVNEMGITSRFFPEENAPNGDLARLAASDHVADPEDQVDPITGKGDIDHAADFMRLLAPPPALAAAQSGAGDAIFRATGCADCHTPSMKTGASAVAALSHREVRLDSDLLLHDMGSLGDGIAQGAATATQMKTAPLWGARASGPYLHDGRATTIDGAILAHAGEAAASRNRYAALSSDEQRHLQDYVNAL